MCLHGALGPIIIINPLPFHDDLKKVLTPGVKEVFKDRICACMFLHSSFLLLSYAT